MTTQEKRTYLDWSMRIGGFTVSPIALDFIVAIFESLDLKGGDTTVKDISKIYATIEEKHKKDENNPTKTD